MASNSSPVSDSLWAVKTLRNVCSRNLQETKLKISQQAKKCQPLEEKLVVELEQRLLKLTNCKFVSIIPTSTMLTFSF